MIPKPQSPSALWDAMTDQQKIEWLAVNVMQWMKREYTWIFRDGVIVPCKTCGSKEHSGHNFKWMTPDLSPMGDMRDIEDSSWNPLTDWNHWREVEEKMMEAGKQPIRDAYFKALVELWGEDPPDFLADIVMFPDLPTRCKAVFLSTNSQNKQ